MKGMENLTGYFIQNQSFTDVKRYSSKAYFLH